MAVSQFRNLRLPLMNLVRMNRVPILQQLQLEEKLLRTSSDNWCIINDGTPDPTIVMGISGKPAELLDVKSVLRNNIPVIKRFTGGGTVIVDCGTVFISFICNKDAVPGLQAYPQPIMAWSSLLYDEVLRGAGDFKLRENDYVFGNLKFGGNAQSITKNRWIHHTSFLWDYEDANMTYLKIPQRAPKYRQARDHSEFICRMKDIIPRSAFIEGVIKATETHFSLKPVPLDIIRSFDTANFAPSSRVLTTEELEATIRTEDQILLSESL
ncbi:Lipoate-protein ligase LplJ [Bienertia sinuspersici]